MKEISLGYCDAQELRSSVSNMSVSKMSEDREGRPEADPATQLTAALRQARPPAAPQVCSQHACPTPVFRILNHANWTCCDHMCGD